MKKPQLICYACGTKLSKTFFLVSMANPADRVFVMGACCKDRADDEGTWALKVESKP
jgi:hypothetical protein